MPAGFRRRVEFALWNFARRNPTLGKPIRYAGRIVMAGADARHRKRMAAELDRILPEDAYERPSDVPTQAWLVSDRAAAEAMRGARVLFNHLRIPYRVAPLSVVRERGPDAVLVLAPGLVVAEKSGPEIAISTETLFFSFKADRLLPHRDGLRSEFAASVLRGIRDGLRLPLVTGMLPPGIGLRLDDIRGAAAGEWLKPMLERGWKPNLGLFLDAFAADGNPAAPWFAALARAGAIELSPHAFSEDRLIFFDLPNHRRFEPSEARALWAEAEGIMARRGFPISSVINAHFHVLCPNMANVLAERGLRYLYSEYELGAHRLGADKRYWPSGDSLHATGRLHDCGIFQLAAGDNMATLMNPSSHYDFLMHARPGDTDAAARRALERARLSLSCGFPAFLTSHEFMLRKNLSGPEHVDLWTKIESGLNDLGAPPKVGLETLGERCRDHRTTVVWSVARQASGALEIELRGTGEGGALTVLGAGERSVAVAPFRERAQVRL
jgi:hypothetical protein